MAEDEAFYSPTRKPAPPRQLPPKTRRTNTQTPTRKAAPDGPQGATG